jgi:UDP-3-O-[3-hydroxymyristoyl] glucosamine N-acyltransferase
VIGDVKSGAEVVGFPAADRKQAMRDTVTVRRLVELYKPLKALVDLLPALTERSQPGR